MSATLGIRTNMGRTELYDQKIKHTRQDVEVCANILWGPVDSTVGKVARIAMWSGIGAAAIGAPTGGTGAPAGAVIGAIVGIISLA